MDNELKCPICGSEMPRTTREKGDYTRPAILYQCENGHEQVEVKFERDYMESQFVYLGKGCYLVGYDNSSCERAINRMRKEYHETSNEFLATL